VSRRDESLPAENFRPLAPGIYARAGSVPCVVRGRPGAWLFTLGRDAALPAGATLLRATEHAGGHAARVEMMAERNGDDLCGACATCTRLAKEAGDGNNSGAGALREP